MKKDQIYQFDIFSNKLLNGVTALEDIMEADKKQRDQLYEQLYPNHKKLVVLSFGGGQDSTAILYKYAYDADFRKEYAPNDFIVVMSDTGNEHEGTIEHVAEIREFCKNQRIPFFFITNDQGYHGPTWQSLVSQYRHTSTCGSKAFRKSCTDQLKIRVIYRFLEDYVKGIYRLTLPVKNKQTLVEFAEMYGKITVLIGIAAGEDARIAKPLDLPIWQMKTIERRFPLIELGMNRQACQDYISSVFHVVPPPSNCKLCPYMNEIELLWLYHNYPADFQEWVELEAAKIEKFKHLPVNLGVWPNNKLLPQVLEGAQKKYAHMSMDEINEYKMSHGHCVSSKY